MVVGFVRPGRNVVDVTRASRGKHVTATVWRDGHVDGWQNGGDSSAPRTTPPTCGTLEEQRPWERTAAWTGKLPSSEIVFKCIDAGKAVVVRAALGEREEKQVSDSAELAASDVEIHQGGVESLGNDRIKREDTRHVFPENEDIQKGRARSHSNFVASGLSGSSMCGTDDRNMSNSSEGRDETSYENRTQGLTFAPQDKTSAPPRSTPEFRQESEAILSTASRPQICIPLVGAGDAGCVGIIGVQGFNTDGWTASVDAEDRDWLAHRMMPLDRDQNRAVKQLKLVRPRKLPIRGKLENVPTGTAAAVVYGTVEQVTRKRGSSTYTVR